MKRLIIFLSLILCGVAHSAQIVNVEYIHNAIAQKWDITIPYNSELTNPRVAANMKYLLTAVDVANEMLNGEPTTEYGNGEFATLVAADTIATDTAVETLVKKIDKNQLIMTFGASADWAGTNRPVKFDIAAAGTFVIDWGDGDVQTIEKNDTTTTTYEHTYSLPDAEYTVRISGRATAYNNRVATFSLYDASLNTTVRHLTKLDGCLGCIFPTLDDGSQPGFSMAFMGQSWVTGEIPAGFFAGIHGTPDAGMFYSMFTGSGFTSIGAPLFDDLSFGLADGAFEFMFRACYGLTGESAKMKLNDGSIKYLYEVYPDAPYDQVGGCYYGASGLTDYANMPYNWKNWNI